MEHSGGLTGGHYTACVKVRPQEQDLSHFFSPSLSRPGETLHGIENVGFINSFIFPGDIPKFLQEIQNKVKQTRLIEEEEEEEEEKSSTAGDKRWFLVSDSHVSEVTEDRVLKSQAYLLFYERIL